MIHNSTEADGSDKDIGQYDGTMAIDGARATKISVLGYAASPKTSKRRMQSINLTMAEFAPLRTANMVRLKVGLKLDRTFALTGMAALGRTLDRCIVDLRQVWNLPAAAPPPNLSRETSGASPLPTTIFPRPEQPLASYFKSEDYPGVAIMSGGTGNVALMMLVDEKGKLAACSVIEASGLASLDWQSCAVIATKVTFRPALDPSGKPIKGGLIQRIRWMLPTR